MPSGTPLHSLPWLQKRSCFYNACCKWDNSGFYLGIHYICIMLCTVKVEQLGLQNILEQLYLTTLLRGVSLKYFSHFYYTGTRGCVTDCPWCLQCPSFIFIEWIMNILYVVMIKAVSHFYRPRAYNSVRLVIWWKLCILLFEKRQSKGKKKPSYLWFTHFFL